MKMNMADNVSFLLVLIGGLNWGLIGFFDYSLVDKIFGAGATATNVVYDLVGLAAVYMVLSWAMKMGKKSA